MYLCTGLKSLIDEKNLVGNQRIKHFCSHWIFPIPYKQDLKKSVTASIRLFCLFFKLPFFYFLFFKFLFFTSFSFLLLLYFLFTFQVLCTLLSKSYFIFFSFSKLLPLSDTIWSDPTRSDFAFSILPFQLDLSVFVVVFSSTFYFTT